MAKRIRTKYTIPGIIRSTKHFVILFEVLTLILIFFCALTLAEDINDETKNEVSHLLDYLKSSNCKFYRNGSWYDPAEAVNHINKKYQYLLKKDLIVSTENFIERAASKSSISGEPYLVKCGIAKPIESANWFRAELVRFRAKSKQQR